MATPGILEVDEERIPKERPPKLDPVPPGSSGDMVIDQTKESRFKVFGRTYTYSPREVSRLSRIVALSHHESMIGDFIEEDRKLELVACDDPESVFRLWNYARLARGRTLVLGLGLGLFPRLAVRVSKVIVVEPNVHAFKLVWPTVSAACATKSPGFVIDRLEDYLGRAPQPFDFIFFDMEAKSISKANRLIALARRFLAKDGRIMFRFYRSMIESFQRRCQEMIMDILVGGGPRCVDPARFSADEKIFFAWACKNRKRVFEKLDYKFVNSWARRTALELTE